VGSGVQVGSGEGVRVGIGVAGAPLMRTLVMLDCTVSLALVALAWLRMIVPSGVPGRA
jgi:hypothetical protein